MATIKHILHIQSPILNVFQKMSTPEGIAEWWTEETTGNGQIGGELHFKFGEHYHNIFQVTALISPNHIEWKCVKGVDAWLPTEVRIVLSEAEGKTKVDFQHVGYQDDDEFFANCNFSWGRYLLSLRQLCETDQGEPYRKGKKLN